ncbi:hypothetical protein C5S32_11390 [ANME-1 cluster archaeon GoMg1]|nr:hypothetical protein [ANME-1 cluster archaeon GoMg1]
MKISSQLKGGIYEVSFGFHSKLDGYAALMLDIPKLYGISCYLKNIYIIYSNINVLKEIKHIQRDLHNGRHLNV